MIRLLNGRPVYWLTCTTRVRKYSSNFSDNKIDIFKNTFHKFRCILTVIVTISRAKQEKRQDRVNYIVLFVILKKLMIQKNIKNLSSFIYNK
jgi:hypothetical protein